MFLTFVLRLKVFFAKTHFTTQIVNISLTNVKIALSLHTSFPKKKSHDMIRKGLFSTYVSVVK